MEVTVDLLFIDPPYNLGKRFGERDFKKIPMGDYTKWIDKWLSKFVRIVKSTASIYICSDWRSSTAVHAVAGKYFRVRKKLKMKKGTVSGSL